MIRLKQVIKYDNANALEATWVDDVEIVTQIPDPDWSRPLKLDAEMVFVVDEEAVQPMIDQIGYAETPVRCHAYDETQMDMLRADIGDEMTVEIEALIAQVDASRAGHA